MIIFDDIEFYKEGEVVGESSYINTRCDIASIEISGDDGAEFVFEGRVDNKIVDEADKQWMVIMGMNLSTYTKEASFKGSGIWEVGIEGIHEFRLRKVSGDSANVFGRLVITAV